MDEALRAESYRVPMAVRTVRLIGSGPKASSYPICPKCGRTWIGNTRITATAADRPWTGVTSKEPGSWSCESFAPLSIICKPDGLLPPGLRFSRKPDAGSPPPEREHL